MSERLAQLFTHAGAEVTLHWESAGHTITPGEVDAAQRWLVQHLPARPKTIAPTVESR